MIVHDYCEPTAGDTASDIASALRATHDCRHPHIRNGTMRLERQGPEQLAPQQKLRKLPRFVLRARAFHFKNSSARNSGVKGLWELHALLFGDHRGALGEMHTTADVSQPVCPKKGGWRICEYLRTSSIVLVATSWVLSSAVVLWCLLPHSLELLICYSLCHARKCWPSSRGHNSCWVGVVLPAAAR